MNVQTYRVGKICEEIAADPGFGVASKYLMVNFCKNPRGSGYIYICVEMTRSGPLSILYTNMGGG